MRKRDNSSYALLFVLLTLACLLLCRAVRADGQFVSPLPTPTPTPEAEIFYLFLPCIQHAGEEIG